ncbi:MAG: site-specific integrase [Planctomycetota bacterium]|nr:site-specific integrase [Planctomycetota bacterium]
MASLQLVSDTYYICFRFAGRRFKRSLKTDRVDRADARRVRLEETLRLVETGRIEVPDDTEDVVEFLLADGKPKWRKPLPPPVKTTPPSPFTLKLAFDEFFKAIPDGNLEQSTLSAMHIHERHLLRAIGSNFAMPNLGVETLQDYVNKRCKQKTRSGTFVSGRTIEKELATLRTVWRWAANTNKVVGPFPRQGLRLPKSKQQPSFQTWQEIERQIELEQLAGQEAAELWDALYLRRLEIDELLAHVHEAALHPFIYPMFVMAAHTGARRSELIRSRRSDFDFEGNTVTIREKKRVRSNESTRRVQLSPTLKAVMHKWLEQDHPGGAHTFCLDGRIPRSRIKEPRAGLSPDQAHDHFERTLKNSKWEKIKGWHCLRHSFISNLASLGIDQRIIDDFVGHTTEQMRRRYRHLFPDVKQAAIDAVFG